MIECTRCKQSFEPTSKQVAFINESAKKGMNMIMLTCQVCKFSAPYYLTPEQNKELQRPLRTPLLGSTGFISHIEDGIEIFYGCGETGAIWRDKKNLYRDIEKIINDNPERSKCYIKSDDEWLPNPNEPSNMNEIISREERTELDQYEQD